jgi:hypothetical protein
LEVHDRKVSKEKWSFRILLTFFSKGPHSTDAELSDDRSFVKNKANFPRRGRKDHESCANGYTDVEESEMGSNDTENDSLTERESDNPSLQRRRARAATTIHNESRDSAFRGRAITAELPRAVSSDEEEAALLRGDWPKVPGPFSAAAKQAAVQLGRRTRLEAARIAQQFKKAPREVLIHASLGVRSSRLNSNPSNKYKIWYAAHRPKPKHSESLSYLVLSLVLRLLHSESDELQQGDE